MRRTAIKALYEQGALKKGERVLWWQLTRLTLQALPALAARFIKRLGQLCYAAYADICFGVLGFIAWCAAFCLPSKLRFQSIRMIARGLLYCWGIPVQVVARSSLKTPCIIAANHASYLDSLILFALLPEKLTFIAKQELTQHFISRNFLKKLGTIFVERFDFAQSAADMEKISQLAEKSGALVFFPEGTFQRAPGLMPFHMGAFVIAASHHLPIIPIGIKGSREILPADCWTLRRGKLTFTIGQPIYPKGSDWSAALALSKEVRNSLLQLTGEVDDIKEY
jgi:1-acyl-sn-glycerol-3-phosphate acyltransferase